MNIRDVKSFAFVLILSAVFVAQAEIVDRPQGVKIGQRMTLRPYVSFNLTYDSNDNQQSGGDGQTSWYVNPRLELTYKSERFNVDAGVFYGYRAYNSSTRDQNNHDYGEHLNLSWTTAAANEKGWSVLLSERFVKMIEDDDIQSNEGRGLWRNRNMFDVQGVVERRFTEKLHANVNGSYYYLDYDNDGDRYAPLYGWQRLMAGAEIGYALSQWTDFIIDGNYQSYTQDNSDDITGQSDAYGTRNDYGRNSQGYTLMGGVQSRATEKISYRLLAGWSRFEYAEGAAEDDGFMYSASVNWKINATWNTMLLAQSYYQPSERDYGSANRVDAVSWGLRHSMIRGKLNGTIDASYRRETRSHTDESSYDYDEDVFAFRLGLDYTINRFFAIYARGEYQRYMFDGDIGGEDRDYDRFRVTIGFRLQY